MTMKKTYTELIQIPDFEGRVNYLKTYGSVAKETFGYDRYLNQMLYRLPEWKRVRRQVIIRDNCCDLAHPDHEIHPYGRKKVVIVHHINPITKEDILEIRSRSKYGQSGNGQSRNTRINSLRVRRRQTSHICRAYS